MPRLRTKAVVSAPHQRIRRNDDQLIADLQAKIAHIKTRAATKAARKDPALRHVTKAIRSIDAAMAETGDAAWRTALQEARVTLGACLQLEGIAVPQNGRSGCSVEAEAILAFVRSNPGQRGEHIAAALGVDTTALRRTMNRLIEGGKVRTNGERRGMQYFAG